MLSSGIKGVMRPSRVDPDPILLLTCLGPPPPPPVPGPFLLLFRGPLSAELGMGSCSNRFEGRTP